MEARIFLAIPTMGWLHAALAVRVVEWLQRHPLKLRVTDGWRPAPYCRNRLVREFLATDCTHYWCIDHDTVPPANALDLLLEADVPAISGIVHQMKLDNDGVVKPVPMVVQRDNAGEYRAAVATMPVERIDACGSACVLYRREVFEKLEFPWYAEKPWGEVRGSDWLLCERMAEAEIPLYAHFDVVCMHRKEVDI